MLSLNEIECYILDMDGTIYLGNDVIDGAHDLLSYFDAQNIPYYFFTNNSSKSPKNYIDKLNRLGFGQYPINRIITSGNVTADYILKTYGTDATAYVVGTQPLVDQLTSAGIVCTDTGTPDCVVVGFDTTYNFEKAARAVDLLRSGVPFLATNVDKVCPLEGGKVLPDCASICAMLTVASGAEPQYLGKPYPETAAFIQRYTNTPYDKIAVIGDRLYTDMRLAFKNGMCSIGVLSGEMTRSDIENSDMQLDYLFDSVKDLYGRLKNE